MLLQVAFATASTPSRVRADMAITGVSGCSVRMSARHLSLYSPSMVSILLSTMRSASTICAPSRKRISTGRFMSSSISILSLSGSTMQVKGRRSNSSPSFSAVCRYTWSSAPMPQPGMSEKMTSAPPETSWRSLSTRFSCW